MAHHATEVREMTMHDLLNDQAHALNEVLDRDDISETNQAPTRRALQSNVEAHIRICGIACFSKPQTQSNKSISFVLIGARRDR